MSEKLNILYVHTYACTHVPNIYVCSIVDLCTFICVQICMPARMC